MESGRGKPLHTGLATSELGVIHPLSSGPLFHYRTASRLFLDQDAFRLMANQGQGIHLAANSGYLYHFYTMLALPISDSVTTSISHRRRRNNTSYILFSQVHSNGTLNPVRSVHSHLLLADWMSGVSGSE